MNTSTDLPIHEVILKIMYNEGRDKPKELKVEDILWKIDNPEITERYVREVLNWLVREKRVEVYLDKYSLDRIEFLAQKASNKDAVVEEVYQPLKTSYIIKPPRKNSGLVNKIFFSIGVIALLIVTFLYGKKQRSYEVTTKEIPTVIVENEQAALKNIYLSNSEELTDLEKFKDIAYSFSRQNSNNKALVAEISKLYRAINDTQKKNEIFLNTIQKKTDETINFNIDYTNDLIQKIMIGNIVFLMIIVFAYFKK